MYQGDYATIYEHTVVWYITFSKLTVDVQTHIHEYKVCAILSLLYGGVCVCAACMRNREREREREKERVRACVYV